MFGLFASQEKKMRENAGNWLELADKVWHFRRDRLSDQESGELLSRAKELKAQLKARANAAELKLSIEKLEAVLRNTGGAIYPKTSLTENVEFFLVAAIVILGIRTYFVQPFKIPTNSMWPTYHGMTAENLPADAKSPGPVERVLRFAAFGAQRREAIAPTSGAVTAEFDPRDGRMVYREQDDRTWLVLPTKVREYTFYVDGRPTRLRVPMDFSEVDRLVHNNFFGSEQKFAEQFTQAREERWQRSQRSGPGKSGEAAGPLTLSLNRAVQAGEPVLRFDILTGDQLFVDRMSYHFVQPKVGQGFVFRTGHIAGIGDDQYYIKRLVGVPGDVLEIKEPVLYRNGAPISGAEAFRLNQNRVSPYNGYFNAPVGLRTRSGEGPFLTPGEKLKVPAEAFFALGDNSGNSLDGRYWGFVPAKDAIGRPLFIYYPFTKRWGPAR